MGRRRGSRYDGSSKRSGGTRRSARPTENKLVHHVRHRFAAQRRRLNHGPGQVVQPDLRGSASSYPTTARQTSSATSLRSSGRASTRCPRGPPSAARSCKGKRAPRFRKSSMSTRQPRPSCPPRGDRPRRPGPGGFQARRYNEPMGPDRGDRGHGQVLQRRQELRLRDAGQRRAGRLRPCQGPRPVRSRRSGASAARAAERSRKARAGRRRPSIELI